MILRRGQTRVKNKRPARVEPANGEQQDWGTSEGRVIEHVFECPSDVMAVYKQNRLDGCKMLQWTVRSSLSRFTSGH
jgi:hypothetical protein